jgi:hypothetical protein
MGRRILMAKRAGGATRVRNVVEMAATTNAVREVEEPSKEMILRRGLDVERGTPFDVAGMDAQPWTQLADDEFLVTTMPERQWIEDVDRMLGRGGQPAAVEKALTLPLRSANLTIEKPEGDKGQTEFVREVLYSAGQGEGMKPDLVGIVSQMAHAIAVRKTYHEIEWTQRKDGRLGYSKVAWRPPQTCEPIRALANGELMGFRQYIDSRVWNDTRFRRDVVTIGRDRFDQFGYVRIPKARAVIHVHGQHRDPMNGVSDLSVTHWAYTLQQKILLMWATFLDGTSLPKVAAYGRDKTEAARNAATIASLRGSGVVGLIRDGMDPADKLFELIDNSGAGAAQFVEMVNYLEQQMTKSVLAGFLDLTSNATRGIGSYALSADQSGLFLTSRQAAAKELAATATDQLIAPLVRRNFGTDAAIPRLVFEQMGQEQSTQAMQMLQQLGSVQNGSVPPGFLDLLIERVSQFLDLPDDKVEKLLSEQAEFRKQQAEQLGRTPEQSASPNGQLTDKVNAAQDAMSVKQDGRPVNVQQLRKQATTPAQDLLKRDRQEKQ